MKNERRRKKKTNRQRWRLRGVEGWRKRWRREEGRNMLLPIIEHVHFNGDKSSI